MEQFFQQLLNGLAVGGIYALVALGYTMVYGVLKLINFAHGDLFTIGAYLGLTLLVSCNLAGVLPPVVAVLAVFIMVGIMVAIIGCLLERAAYRPLRKAGRLSAVVSALGASIFFQNAVMLVYGARFYVYPDWLRPDFTVDLFGIAVPGVRLMVIAASVILMLALWAFIQRTRIGAAVRAVAIDQGAARLMGINVDRIISLVFFIGPGLGGAAGLMVGIYYGQIDFTMGWSYGLKAFTAAILGGIGNIPRRHDRRPAAGRHRSPGRRLHRHRLEGCHRLHGADPHPDHPSHGHPGRKDGRQAMNRTIVIVALAAALLVLPLFTNPYWTDVCVSIGLYALLALSLNVILGQAGIFHMGHAAFFAVGAYSTAILNTMYHWPIFLTMPVAGCAAALFALVVARPIIHLRGDYLLIVTIGIVEIVRIALINDVGGLTGGSNGIFGISRPVFFGFRIFKPLHFYYLVWGMVGVSLLLFYGLWRSRIGRALNCIKEDDVAAEGCGINVTHYKLMAFVLGAFWAGMAGTLYAAKMTTIAPESFNFMESVIIFAVVILSGGSQLGVLVSAFLFIGLPELLREFSGARMLIFGLAMMLMMIWRPQGLMPPKSRRYGVAALLEAIKARACAAADGNAVRLAEDARTAEKEGGRA